MGFREVGIYEKHAQLDGQWRDVVIVERLIPENQEPAFAERLRRDTQMKRTVPQVISLVAIVAGVALFVVTMLGIDRTETLNEARRLGVLLPLVLLPSIGWHLLRAAGWYVCFPAEDRPSYWRVFRVRLAADGVGYFTIRGVASEPLRVVLLMGRVPPVVSAAASVLERTAMGIMSVVGVGIFAAFAVSSNLLPPGWEDVFRGIAITAAVVLLFCFLFLIRTGRYFGPTDRNDSPAHGVAMGRRPHRPRDQLRLKSCSSSWRAPTRAASACSSCFSIACYWLMAFEVVLVFWAIGEPISLWLGTIVETFTRSASVAGGAIPGNLGALEASNVAVVKALGLAGGGALALFRRFRSLVFATLGLALYPRDAVAPGADGTGAMSGIIASIQEWASELGGVGLFIIALLDSSFLSFPQVNDLLIIVLSTKFPERMPYYAGMTTLGSLIGCFLLYGVARRGGEVFLRKRLKGRYVDRALKLYQKPRAARGGGAGACCRRRCRSRCSSCSPAQRRSRRGGSALRWRSAAASGISARAISRSCTVSRPRNS